MVNGVLRVVCNVIVSKVRIVFILGVGCGFSIFRRVVVIYKCNVDVNKFNLFEIYFFKIFILFNFFLIKF